MRYLVTGGAGFIGSNLSEALLKKGGFVRILDNFISGKRENINGFNSYGDNFELYVGDLRDVEVCHHACEGVDYVLHQGALGSVPRSIDDPITTNDCNINGTLNILVASRNKGVKRVVLAASSSAYGDSRELPKVETILSLPISPYAVSKYVGEMYARVFFRVYGLETISLRYFNVFGRRQEADSTYAAVIPIFIRSLLRDEAPKIYGDGEQSRDFTYIDNVIEANILACGAPIEACGESFNIACHHQTTLNQLYHKIASLLAKENIHPRYVPPRPGDVLHSLADISKASKYLGYEPKYDLYQGLELAIDWYKENLK